MYILMHRKSAHKTWLAGCGQQEHSPGPIEFFTCLERHQQGSKYLASVQWQERFGECFRLGQLVTPPATESKQSGLRVRN